MANIRVIVADDHHLVREALARTLDGAEGMECIGTAKDGAEAVKLAQKLLPDVAIIDVSMPKMDGIEATKQIKLTCPSTAVLILSAYKYEHYVLASMEAGADGYVLKSNIPSKGLVNAVRMVHDGVSVLDREPSELLRRLAIGKGKQKVTQGDLGNRELQVLKLAAKGMSNKQIAVKLCISDQTVGTHFVNIFRKLEVQSRMGAVLYALRKGWLSVSKLASEEFAD
jgi:DNA-binding NarL/FixJ family response regulator